MSPKLPKSATRILRILEFIATREAGTTHTEIAKALSIPKASLTALLATVKEEGYVQQDPESGRLTIGVQILSLANSYLRNLNLVRIGAPIVAALYRDAGLFSVLAVPQSPDYVIICAESQPALLTHSLQIGHRGPMFCSAAGRAILSALPESEVDRTLAHSDLRKITTRTIYEPTRIKRALEEANEQGYAVSNGESIENVVSVCAPVFDWTGQPIAAIGVAGTEGTMQGTVMKASIELTCKAASSLSAKIGFVPV